MLKSYPLVFLGTILVTAAVMITTGLDFRTRVPYKNMWTNEHKSEYVVFTSIRDGNYEIYSMNPDGSEVSRLTDNLAHDYNPSVSPDGQKIAFASNRDSNMDGNYEIYIMNIDGSDQTRITHSADGDGVPVWSPDGKRIAFTSWHDGSSEIYVMNADGTNQTNLTNHPADDFGPVWSPDGSRIAFDSTRDDNSVNRPDRISKIYLMNADGRNPRLLIDAESRWPSWSPDGTKIAFMYFQESTLPAELHILDLASKTETVLDTGVEFDGRVAWSPDGQEILFTSYVKIGSRAIECEHGQLYRMSATGSAPVQITFGASNEGADWKGVISISPTPVFEIEDTATAEATPVPTIVETLPPTDTPEIVPTEPPLLPTATLEIEDVVATEASAVPTIIETVPPTDSPVIEPTETP